MRLISNEKNIWVDKVGEVYNRAMKSWLQDDDVEIYSNIMKENLLLLKDLLQPLKLKLKFTNIWLQYWKMCTC